MDYRCKGKQNWWHHTLEVRRCRRTKATEKGNADFNGNEGMESGEGQGSKGERDLMQTEPRAPVEADMLERAMIGRFTKRPEKETAWILNALKSAPALVQKVALDCSAVPSVPPLTTPVDMPVTAEPCPPRRTIRAPRPTWLF